MESRSNGEDWRLARDADDERIVPLCLSLYREDPGERDVDERGILRTLAMLRAEPWRGAAVVCETGGRAIGYALLISFWSNEMGGEVCDVDELFVEPDFRGRGYGSSLFDRIERGDLWKRVVAIGLVVNPANERARRLYERLGFEGRNVAMHRHPKP